MKPEYEELKQLIEDLISMMEYHVEQTRPIHSTTVALQAAREALRAQPAPVQEQIEKLLGVFKNVDQHGPLLGMGGKKIGCVNHDCDQCKAAAQRQWTDIDIDNLSVLAGFDPSHKVELGLVRSVVRTILRKENT